MKVAIYSRGFDEEHTEHLFILLQELFRFNIEATVHAGLLDYLQKKSLIVEHKLSIFNTYHDLDESIGCLISLGGDGTLLDTVTLVRDKNIPVMGINFGRLGFLASIGREDLTHAVETLVNHTYVVDERVLIHVNANVPLFSDAPFGLNELVLHKRDISPMVKIHTYLNGEFLNTYWADGLIISTPTGSTGYSMSCGGPIVFPDARSFVITPIAPHSLNVRPIVIPDNNIISFEIESRSDQYICALDARRELVDQKVQVSIKKETFCIQLIRLSENNFLQTLRSKLTWGFDKRN
jgi:NAD+ kinase